MVIARPLVVSLVANPDKPATLPGGRHHHHGQDLDGNDFEDDSNDNDHVADGFVEVRKDAKS